ncbi:response regulator transcription factor [Streptomyces sporangiiformans]|uniref:Response regulator transcription factor n=1 Tax=Streptomyces sporangiiformans TaxID=2315329 RepID=A0A505DKZ0_9ACTN|nr:response regulator transcription factor [Streptomyces sporangiiformans]TPQ20746.1 response regulator transcription factor [Streptomyces sporangiiformans]
MTTVLVVNDQPLQRRGLRMLLAAQPDLTVVGEAATGAEAVRMSAELLPDVVLMDGRTPDQDGIEIIRRVTRSDALPRVPDPARSGGHAPRVLVLTTTSNDEYACTALRAGAGGFLPQDATPDELTAAIHTVAVGDAVLTPGLTRRLIDVVRARPTRPPTAQHRLDALTERERDVLTGVASGWSNAEIAEKLSIAPTTVKSHITRILTKIGARARVQAVVFAYESGLVRRHDADPPPSRAVTIAAVPTPTTGTTRTTRTTKVARLHAPGPGGYQAAIVSSRPPTAA